MQVLRAQLEREPGNAKTKKDLEMLELIQKEHEFAMRMAKVKGQCGAGDQQSTPACINRSPSVEQILNGVQIQ